MKRLYITDFDQITVQTANKFIFLILIKLQKLRPINVKNHMESDQNWF